MGPLLCGGSPAPPKEQGSFKNLRKTDVKYIKRDRIKSTIPSLKFLANT